MRTSVITVAATALVVAVLPSCASVGAPTATGSGALDVRVPMSGGPMRPDGTMALSDSPIPAAALSAVDHSRHRFSGRTDSDGLAVLHLPAGHYTITSRPCGQARDVLVSAGRTAHVTFSCDVP